jgi:hypothetical protein
VQSLNDVLGHDVPGAVVHDVELFAVLVSAGVIVGAAVDSHERPLDVLERHFLILAALRGDLLLVLPLPGRCAITA